MLKRLLKIAMLFFGGIVIAGCGSEYDDGELWSEVNDIDRRVTNIEAALSTLNGDLGTIQDVVRSKELGLSVTSVTQTSEGWRVTYNDGSVYTLPNLHDGQSPYIYNGVWWIGDTNTGVSATGVVGRTPYIGPNMNWWIGQTDTGVPATGTGGGDVTTGVPFLGVDIYADGRYYWTQTLNGVKSWLLDSRGQMMPVSGNDGQRPIIRVNVTGFWVISYDGGITYEYIYDGNGGKVKLPMDGCPCTTYFKEVRLVYPYLILVLVDGTVLRIRIDGGDDGGDIPPDPTDPTPDPGPDPDPDIPNPYDTVEEKIVRLDMTGVQDPVTGEWLKLYGTNMPEQNVWLDLEGKPKGILVINNEDSEVVEQQVKNDIIFTVDNSGSMSEEANTIARDIQAWAQQLQSAGLDVRFACVGYSVSGTINGAIDFCDASQLSSWLTRNGSGTSHTMGFAETRLQTAASSFGRTGGECGGMAIRFADANFSFRTGANRIYINFTDEGNQPGGNANFSVEFFHDQTNWPAAKGTIHTVFSDTSIYPSGSEDPAKMSTYTGGTVFRTNGSFSGVNLDNLTVTEAMKHSYTIYFRVPETYFDNMPHEVRITIITPDRRVRKQRSFYITFNLLPTQ